MTFCDRADEVVGAKHELAVLTKSLLVIREVKHQRTHHGVILFADLLGALKNIRHQSLAPLDSSLEQPLGLGSILPWLSTALIPMNPHEWSVDRGLDPADHPLLIIKIIILLHRTEETA